jgi:orotate phosphoribosyltransferase
MEDLSSAVPVRTGHFLLESGYHTNLWLTLDALFVDPKKMAPRIESLADRLRPYGVSAVCGPLLGGAFLAQNLAAALDLCFLYAQPGRTRGKGGLFAATYDLPLELRKRARGQRVAVVDDAISAGSSVRATVAALSESGASVAVVGALLVLGDAARAHFEGRGIPLLALSEHELPLFEPSDCPLCRKGAPLEDPREGSPERDEKRPRALVEAFYSEIWNRRDVSRITDLMTADVTFRGSLGPTLVGREAFAGYVESVHAVLGTYRCEIVDLVVEGESAFARMRFSGVHRGELLGHPPTGKLVEWVGAALFTVREGRIADLWVLGDVQGLLRRLQLETD